MSAAAEPESKLHPRNDILKKPRRLNRKSISYKEFEDPCDFTEDYCQTLDSVVSFDTQRSMTSKKRKSKPSPAVRDKPKRHQVPRACVNCQKSCKKCSIQRPCDRCVKLGIESECRDGERKRRQSRSVKAENRQTLNQSEVESVQTEITDRRPHLDVGAQGTCGQPTVGQTAALTLNPIIDGIEAEKKSNQINRASGYLNSPVRLVKLQHLRSERNPFEDALARTSSCRDDSAWNVIASSEHEVQTSDSDLLNGLSAVSDSFMDLQSEMDHIQKQTIFKIDTPTTSACSYIPKVWSGSPRSTLQPPSPFQEFIPQSRDSTLSFCEVTEISQPSYRSVSSSAMTPSANEWYQKSSKQSNSKIIQPASYTPMSLPRTNLEVLSDACDLILNSQNLEFVRNVNSQVNPVDMGKYWIPHFGENYPSPILTPPVCIGTPSPKPRQQSPSMKSRQAEHDCFNMNLDSVEIGVLQYQGSEYPINSKEETGKVMSDAQIAGQFSTMFHVGNEFRK